MLDAYSPLAQFAKVAHSVNLLTRYFRFVGVICWRLVGLCARFGERPFVSVDLLNHVDHPVRSASSPDVENASERRLGPFPIRGAGSEFSDCAVSHCRLRIINLCVTMVCKAGNVIGN
jgi:hypothetical protein